MCKSFLKLLSLGVAVAACSISNISGAAAATVPTLTVSQVATNEVSVTLTLPSGDVFATGGAGNSLNFDLSGNPNLTGDISNLSTGFSATSLISGQSIHSDGSGDWQYAFDCSSCGNGTSPPTSSGPLSFDITLTGITPASFIANASGNLFATDIGVPNGNGGFDTGVFAGTAITTTPLPGALVLFGTVLFGAGGMFGRARRRSARSASASA
jgi:hypothetical protein